MTPRSRKVIALVGFSLIAAALGLAVVRAFLPGGRTACAQQCSAKNLNYRYSAPVVGYRNHVVQAENCECY